MAHIGLTIREPKPVRMLMQAHEKAERIAARRPAPKIEPRTEAA